MKRITVFSIITIILLSTCLTGCINEEDKILNQSVDLSTVSLSAKDFNETFEEFDITHITDAYIVEEGLIFSGWRILEKYESRFSVDDVTFLIQQLAKHPTTENASRLIDELQTQDIGYDFTLFSDEKIGDKSFIGSTNTTILGSVNTLYFISFHIENIAVVLVSSNIDYETVFSKAQFIKDRINEEIEKNI